MDCPEEQPRPLGEIVDSAWKMAGPNFQSMSAQQVRMVERLVREAYQRGYGDDQRKRCLNCGKPVGRDADGRLHATDPRDHNPWQCEYNRMQDHLPVRVPYGPPKEAS